MGTLGLSLPENISGSSSGSHKTSSPAPASPGKAALDDFAARIPALSDAEPSLLPELQDLRKESDEELLFQNLLTIGVRLKGGQHLESAQALLGRLSQEDVPEAFRHRAQAELDALAGKGAVGARAEFLLSRFCKDATNPRLILPMMAGTLAGELVGTFTWGRLASTAAEGSSWLGRGLTARFAAGAAGYASEVSAFAAMNHAMAPQSGTSLLEDFERSALTIGALRAFGYSTRSLTESLAIPASSSSLRFALDQSGMFLGLVTSHKLEERLGLRPRVEGSTFLFDTFASMLSLGVGAHLGRSVLGGNFSRFQNELKLRTSDSADLGLQGKAGPMPELALATVAGGLRAPRLSDQPLNTPMLMAAGMGPGGFDGGGKRFDGTQFRPPASEAAEQQPQTISHPRLSPQGTPQPPQAPQLPPPQPITAPAAPDPYLGKLVGDRYEIEAKLGEGGMGFVYRARHIVIGKHVALKVLKPELSNEAESTSRFINEARAATLIGNPHIIEINDFGKMPDGATYFVMEFLKGKPLGDLVEGEVPVPAYRIVKILRQIAEGLSAAHRVGIVHRDLKPDNVFLIEQGHEADYVKILDFGIAKMPRAEGGTKLTQVGQVFGTPAYFSPEQAAGNPVDERGDIYSLGALAYEMATGKLPFMALTPLDLMHKHMFHPLTPPRELPSTPKDFPPELEAIILRCMAKQQAQRYQTMDEVIVELDRLMAGIAPKAVEMVKNDPEAFNEPDEAYIPMVRKKSLRPAIVGLSTFTAIASMITAFWAVLGGKNEGHGPSGSVAPSAPPPPPANPVPSNLTNPTIVEKREVQVTVEPVDAHIFQDGKDLGSNFTRIEVEAGKSVTIEVRKSGYETKTLVLDGSHSEEKVQLNREPKKKIIPKNGVSGLPSAPKPKSSRPGDDVVVPWK